MENPVRIPDKILDWRDTKPEGYFMSRASFRGIESRATSRGYDVPSAVAGKTYWITVVRSYLDTHPGDRAAQRTLRALSYRSNPRRRHSKLYESLRIKKILRSMRDRRRRGYGPGDIGLIAPTSSYWKATGEYDTRELAGSGSPDPYDEAPGWEENHYHHHHRHHLSDYELCGVLEGELKRRGEE